MGLCDGADGLIIKTIEKEYQKVLVAKDKIDVAMAIVDGKLGVLGALPPESLPSIPSDASTKAAIDTAKEGAQTSLDQYTCVSSLTGSCLGGAVGGLSDLIKDTSDFLTGAIDELKGLVTIPDDIFDISDALDVVKKLIKSTGIDKLIKSIVDKVGCVAVGNPVIDDIVDDLSTITVELGLNPDGTYEDTTFEDFFGAKVDAIGGFPSDFKQNMKDVTKNLGDMSKDLDESAKTNAKALKKSTSKLKVSLDMF